MINRAIDTNVLLENTFEQIQALLKKENEDLMLVIPLQVIKELDTFKVGLENKNFRARQAIRFIEEARKLGSLTKGVNLGNGIWLRVGVNKIQTADQDGNITEEHTFLGEATTADQQIILESCMGESEDEDLVFVSQDIHARILAEIMGIESTELPMDQNTRESGPVEKSVLRIDDDQLATLYRNYKNGLPIHGDYNPNDFIEMRDSTNASHYGIYDKALGTVKRFKTDPSAWGIKPRCGEDGEPIIEQALLMQYLLDPTIEFVSAIGSSGTGKTFLTLACALEQTLGPKPRYKKIIIMRPLAAIDRDLGALPGDKIEKLTPWLGSVIDNLTVLLDNSMLADADDKKKSCIDKNKVDRTADSKKKYDYSYLTATEQITRLIEDGIIELEALTYIRGRSIPDALIIIEDAQNGTYKEATTIVTRVGEGSKLVFLGDVSPAQIDNPRLNSQNNGLSFVTSHLYGVDESIACVTMSKVVRSHLASLGVEYLQ